ncbi:hypothetical protein VTP01DRAFT_8659 [Rhizomucor pusillus]|uniref:uncharacterized protein n=1 Tax=Rhizomucor pusillus TaxID=4840 RepID=UPI0037435007
MCDVLTAEDKTRTCSAKDLGECIDKATTHREKTLDAWQRRLPFANLIEKFDVMSVLWHERTLTVYQTSKIKDTFFHYKLMTATLQDTPGGYTHLARLLIALLSLKACGQRVQVQEYLFYQALRNGSLSPYDIDAQDDSIELADEEMAEIVALLADEEANLERDLEKVIIETSFDEQILGSEELSQIFNE